MGLLLICGCGVLAVVGALNPPTVLELITAQGYPVEQHFATTADGFILSVQRIPFSAQSPATTNKPVVFLQHGLEDSSATWVVNLANESLAFILADAGFDVWCVSSYSEMFNLPPLSRGAADRNVQYTYKQREFWDWSMDQMAQYDVPAMVDYALNATGAAKLGWVGHSQGTMQMFFALSTQGPVLAAKLNVFVALAPVAYARHISSPLLRVLADFHVDALIELMGVQGFFFNDTQWITHNLPELCKLCELCCSDIVEAIMGDLNRANLNETRMQLYLAEFPAGTSTENIVHFAQLARSDTVAMYDYGSKKLNEEHYNQSSPPDYHLSVAGVPTALFTGGRDTLADPTDVAQLVRDLGNATGSLLFINTTPRYTHMDFVWGLDCGFGIYADVQSVLEQHATFPASPLRTHGAAVTQP